MKTYQVAVLVLHDLGNFAFQVLQEASEDCNEVALKEIAENLNQCFTLAGNTQFKAEVNIEEREDIADIESQAETLYEVGANNSEVLAGLSQNQIRGMFGKDEDV